MPPQQPPPLLAAIPETSRRKRQPEFSPAPPASQPDSLARQAALVDLKDRTPPQPVVFLPPEIAKASGGSFNQAGRKMSKTSSGPSEKPSITTATSFWSNHDESTATGGAIGRAG